MDMRVKDLEAFRAETFKSIKGLFLSECDVTAYKETLYDEDMLRPENRNAYAIHRLTDVLSIQKYHYDDLKVVRDKEMFITVREDGIWFFLNNRNRQRFDYIASMDFEFYESKTVFLMELAMEISMFVNELGHWGKGIA